MAEPDATTKELHYRADVSARRIAKVYAVALLNAAEKAGQTGEVLEEFDSLVRDVMGKDRRLSVLLSPAVGRDVRGRAIEKAFADRAGPIFYNFLQVLNQHERLDLMRPILGAATELNDERNRRLRVYVQSAIPLPDDMRQRLENGVRVIFQLEPVLIDTVDPDLLGGLKIRIGDMQYDATVRNKIETLRHQILAKGSHEIQSRRDRFSSDAGN